MMKSKELTKRLLRKQIDYIKHVRNQEEYINSFGKICPKCGNILPIDAKGCNECLLQFDIRSKQIGKRY